MYHNFKLADAVTTENFLHRISVLFINHDEVVYEHIKEYYKSFITLTCISREGWRSCSGNHTCNIFVYNAAVFHRTHQDSCCVLWNIAISSLMKLEDTILALFPVSTPSFFLHVVKKSDMRKKAGSGDWE